MLSLPKFSSLNIDTFVADLDQLLQQNLTIITTTLTDHRYFDWDNLIKPLEEIEDSLERFWSPLAHLHAVVNSEKLRQCYQACLPKLASYEAAITHNQQLYNAINAIDRDKLDDIQNKIITDMLRDFQLSGVALDDEKKHRFELIQARLSTLANQFENNILDATDAFNYHVTDELQLKGLPAHALQTAQALAKEKGLVGWVLNLESPCYQAIITYAQDRALRELFYHAYVTRASDVGPHASKYDNGAVIDELLALAYEKAQLLGFENYAELSIATKMASSSQHVIGFLDNLVERSYPQAKKESVALIEFAQQSLQLTPLKPWDIAYASEKSCLTQHQISQEALRAYFPKDAVITGLFAIVERLYGMQFKPIEDVDRWHQDVECYTVIDEHDVTRGFVYLDLFARANKRGGAWMDVCQSRRRLDDGSIQQPIALLTCNFAKPAQGKMATFSHDEVLTLFHEFGHCLHHLLTKVDYIHASGIHGVEWDAVELPSQIFENWCWESQSLALISQHVDTKEPLPLALYEKLIAAKNFQSALAMLRQLELSLFDFTLYQHDNKANSHYVRETLANVRRRTALFPVVDYNRFQHSFSHIFAGGYAAGYYSYKWAEVLASDAYAKFEENGIFDAATGRAFLTCILEIGSTVSALKAFISFRGREPTIDALLRHNGING